MSKSLSNKSPNPVPANNTQSPARRQFTNPVPSPNHQQGRRHIPQLVTCDLRDYISQSEGIFKEKEFRRAIREEDWSRFRGKRVLIKGCGNGLILPTWAFMVVTAHLLPYAKNILYGDECAPITISKNPVSPQDKNLSKSQDEA